MEQKYSGSLAERKKQAHDAWKQRFIARDPEGYKKYMCEVQKRDRERYGEKRRARSREYYQNHKRCKTLREKYGISETQFNSTLTAQGGCAICGAAQGGGRFNRFHTDHDHATGAVRGILCDACNRGLGLFRESWDLLGAAMRYLQSPPGLK
jgi:hypothetical protein